MDDILGKFFCDRQPPRLTKFKMSEPLITFPETSALGTKSLKKMHEWLSQCVESESTKHVGCSKSKENPAPLRLLEAMDGDSIRLVEVEGKTEAYAILSYCWGGSKALENAKTTTKNIATRLARFPLSSIPQTLQDSVMVARRLKIPIYGLTACVSFKTRPKSGAQSLKK